MSTEQFRTCPESGLQFHKPAQILPGYEMVLTITPDTSGEQTIICNEFCGIGHHNMLGKIFVTEGGS